MIDDFFYQRQIDFDSVMQEICNKFPNSVFAFNRSQIYTITVPAATEDVKYALFSFPGSLNPRHFVNGKESKTDDVRIIFGEPITATLVESAELVSYFPFCRHGNFYLVDREESESTINMKMTMTDRNPDYLMDDVRLAIKNIYYNLLTRNIEGCYKSMNLLSDAVNNHVSSNQRVLPLIAHDVEEEESYML